MPDFADLIFTVDVSDLAKSEKFIENVIRSAKKLGITVEQSARQSEQAAQKTTKSQRAIEAQTKKTAAETARAAKATEAALKAQAREQEATTRKTIAAAKKEVAEKDRQARAYRNLKAQIDPTYHAELRYAEAVEKVNAALSQGLITQAESIRMLALVEAQTIGAGEANNILTNNLTRFGLTSRQARGNVQQLSYQVQDLFITLQAGQPLMVILAQQGSQIASIFGPKGAIAGMALSLGALLGTTLTSMLSSNAEEARSTEEVYGDLASTFRETQEISDVLAASLKNQSAGLNSMTEEAMALLGVMESIGRTSASAQLRDALENFGGRNLQETLRDYAAARGPTEVIAGFRGEPVPDYIRQRMSDPYFDQEVDFGLNFEQLVQMQTILSNISGQTAPEVAQSFAQATVELERQGLLTEQVSIELNKIAQNMGIVGILADNQNNKQLQAWNQYYQSRVAGLQYLVNEEARQHAAYLQYYQSRIQGAQFLANQQAMADAAALAGWNQYYQSRVQGDQFLANQRAAHDAAALAGWQQYYQSRVTGQAYLQATLEAETAALVEQYSLMAQTRGESDTSTRAGEAMLETYQSQLAILEAIREYGADSVQVTELRVQAELKSLDATLALMDIAPSLKEQIREMAEEAIRLANSSGDAVGTFGELSSAAAVVYGHINDASTAMQVLASMEPADGWLSGAIAAASTLAGNLWSAAQANATIANQNYNQRMANAYGLYARTRELAPEFPTTPEFGGPQPPNRPPMLGEPELPDTGGGNGGGGGEPEQSDYDKVIENLKQEIELIGLSTQARRLQQELQRAGVTINSEEGQSIAELVEKMYALEEAEEATLEARQRMENFFSDLGGALSDVVVRGESARDALANVWKNMASDLLQSGLQEALMAVFAPEGSTGGIFSTIMSIFSPVAAPSTGPVESFDGGGMTKSGPRSGGVDGKGGYYAIVHPNEKITDLTKNPSFSETTPTVGVQSTTSDKMDINISLEGANGDETIRSITYEAIARALTEQEKSFKRRVKMAVSDPFGA